MYYNNSTFPIFLYKINFGHLSYEDLVKNLCLIIEQNDFKTNFLERVAKEEKQHLFGYLVRAYIFCIFLSVYA
jgi:hypothetical protein